MQAGASRDHERIAKAVFAALYAQVDPGVFDVNKGDFGVRVGEGAGRGSVLYPDVVVDRQSGDGDERVTTTAMVIAEVLSPSTDLAHHVRKLDLYQRLESFGHLPGVRPEGAARPGLAQARRRLAAGADGRRHLGRTDRAARDRRHPRARGRLPNPARRAALSA